jgi:hypothetical protein
VLIVVEVVLVLPRALRLTKQLRALNLLLDDNVRLAHDELQILNQTRTETQALLRPYMRLAKWLTHPLVVALFASYRRRAARRRSAAPAR